MYSPANNQIDTTDLTLEDFETALLVVEHFMRKYQQAQTTANRIAMFTRMGQLQQNKNASFSPDNILQLVLADKAKKNGTLNPEPVTEQTTTPPEDIARMKDLVNRASKRTKALPTPSENPQSSSPA